MSELYNVYYVDSGRIPRLIVELGEWNAANHYVATSRGQARWKHICALREAGYPVEWTDKMSVRVAAYGFYSESEAGQWVKTHTQSPPAKPKRSVFRGRSIEYKIANLAVQYSLPNNTHVLFDLCDLDLVDFYWRNCEGYACRSTHENGLQKTVRMHRVILSRVLGRDLFPSEQVDHVDGNTLNNTRANLRLATHSQNQRNKKRPITNTSGYKGVSYNGKKGTWVAQIRFNRKTYKLGEFSSPELAHEAYKQSAIEHFGEFARFE